jgi:hypothetical protein
MGCVVEPRPARRPVKRDRIPLPPTLLTIVPFVTMPHGAALAQVLFGPSAIVVFIGAAVGFILPLVWLAKRTRR